VPSFKSVRPVAFSADEMFDLVADVEKYPEFVPLCESLTVQTREVAPDGTGLIVATMGIGYKGIRERFTTHVTLDRANGSIIVRHRDGPFRRLENVWTFAPRAEQGSDVVFAIDYEFRSPALGLLMGAVFDSAFRRFAEAFEARAAVVYRRHLAVPRTAAT